MKRGRRKLGSSVVVCLALIACKGEVRGGSREVGPNKRCIDGVCHQVGRCERDHG